MPQVDPALPRGTRHLRFEVIDSTNAEAMRRATAGEPGPLWVWAGAQSLGRGRSGRTWTSVAGNLYASLLTRLECRPDTVYQLSLLTGVAVVDAIRAAAAERGRSIPALRLKWPNDVLIGTAKVAGILPESMSVPGDSRLAVVVGIGLNLAGQPDGLGRDVTHLAAHGVDCGPEAALGLLDDALQSWLTRWKCGAGFADIRAAWLERAGRVGEPAIIHAGTERVEGVYVGIDEGGSLILRDPEGRERRFSYGDVTLGAAAAAVRGPE